MEKASSIGGKLWNYWKTTNFPVLKEVGIFGTLTAGFASGIGIGISNLKSDLFLLNAETERNKVVIE